VVEIIDKSQADLLKFLLVPLVVFLDDQAFVIQDLFPPTKESDLDERLDR